MNTRRHLPSLSSVGHEMPRAALTIKPKWTLTKKNDILLIWIILAAILFSLPFIKEGDYSILASAIAATVACLLSVALVGYSLTSMVSIVALTHLLFYPLAAWGNLLLPEQLMRWDLWVSTDLAMWGCMVGVLGLGLGAFIAGRLTRPPRASAPVSKPAPLPSFKFNLSLALLIVPVLFIKLTLGLYYHSAISDYSMEKSSYLNLIELMLFISHAGIFLQTFRYCRTHLARDGYWAIAFCIFHILVFMPSGVRSGALAFTPLLFLAYLSWESRTSKKLMAMLGSLVLIPALIYGIGQYRNIKNVQLLSFEEQLNVSLRSPLGFYQKGGQEISAIGEVILRLSDYCAAGRVIADTPDRIPYRGSDQLDKLWQIFVPGFLDIIPDRINLTDGADLCELYGVTTSYYRGGGSSPIMIIGDLFSRWGWPGVFLGMAVIGFLLRQIDLRILFRWDTFTILFYVLFGRQVTAIVTTSLVNIFLTFTRELLAMALCAYVLARWSNLKSPYHNPHGRFPVSKRFSEKIDV
jgi:hypothetical protein